MVVRKRKNEPNRRKKTGDRDIVGNGCGGSTGLTVQAINWAMDPNGDSDLSDHLDVINMSLGSDYGSADDADAVEVDNAARAGIVVISSAGNSRC